MMTMSARNRSPFTSIQWQELEQQALIFKYMIAGVPIPPDLISTVKRSLESSIMSSRFFPHQPIGWGSFQMGFGRKADPEPGRCRRTDGKKWRCSKEAHPDSKYCERHMHRGRNRSRKPVELITSTNSNSSSSAAAAVSSSSSSTITALSLAESYPFVYPQYPSSSSSRPTGSFLSPQNNATHHLFLDSGSSSSSLTERDYSNIGHGVLRDGEMDERVLFREASGSVMRRSPPTPNHYSFTPWTMSSSGAAYSQLQYQSHQVLSLTGNNSNNSRREEQHQQQQQGQHKLQEEEEEEKKKHCFILGTDFKSLNSSPPFKVEEHIREEEKHKPFHHFFGEWGPKNSISSSSSSSRDIDVTAHDQQINHSFSTQSQRQISRPNFFSTTTQLSISVSPSSAQELLGSNSKSFFPTCK